MTLLHELLHHLDAAEECVRRLTCASDDWTENACIRSDLEHVRKGCLELAQCRGMPVTGCYPNSEITSK